jgi:uncharacterized protein (TIGR00251 family)
MRIKIKVHVNSKQEKIVKISEGEFEVWIKERPIENKANKYLEKLFKKYFEKEVKIIKGLKSKNKILELMY